MVSPVTSVLRLFVLMHDDVMTLNLRRVTDAILHQPIPLKYIQDI